MIAYIVAAEIDIIKRCIFVFKKNGMVKFLSPTAFAGAKMDEFFFNAFLDHSYPGELKKPS